MIPIYELSKEAQDNLINMVLNYDYTLHVEHDDEMCDWDDWLIDHDQYTEEELEIIYGGVNIHDIYELPQFKEAKTDHMYCLLYTSPSPRDS